MYEDDVDHIRVYELRLGKSFLMRPSVSSCLELDSVFSGEGVLENAHEVLAIPRRFSKSKHVRQVPMSVSVCTNNLYRLMYRNRVEYLDMMQKCAL